jgi:uncharacterized protein YydD (DUF2326 family)
MRLVKLGSNDSRFRTLSFHSGDQMNLLIADKTRPVGIGDTRNGTGKTATVNLVRYLLGGNKPSDLAKENQMQEAEFFGVFELPGRNGELEAVTVRRALNSTKVRVEGSSLVSAEPLTVKEWGKFLRDHVFRVPEGVERPTVSQLIAQFARTTFLPTKTHPSEADWDSGCRYAFLFGLDAGIAANAGEVARLTRQQTALSQAARDGALADLKLDVPALRGRLVTAIRQREESAREIGEFRVEERYADHQRRANHIGVEIRNLNEQEIILQRRMRELERAIGDESQAQSAERIGQVTKAVYEEVGLSFTDVTLKRFDDVEAFRLSIVKNRQIFLENEKRSTEVELREVQEQRRNLDNERSSVMSLLRESVAMGTYLEAQASLAGLDAEIAGIKDRLSIAENLDNISENRDAKAVEAKRRMRLEVNEQESTLDEARALFGMLASEIYGHGSGKTKSAVLDLGVSPKQGGFLVKPEISADASAGIASVKTFIMDMVTMAMAARSNHTAGFIIHDSALFDPVDSEQIASCLNIGARLAEEYSFQYIVTMNSDTLQAAIADSGGGFDETPYLMDVRLSDESNEQRLFGIQFG